MNDGEVTSLLPTDRSKNAKGNPCSSSMDVDTERCGSNGVKSTNRSSSSVHPSQALGGIAGVIEKALARPGGGDKDRGGGGGASGGGEVSPCKTFVVSGLVYKNRLP